ncbi:MAG: glycosyltransferase [Chloracidobacterium sp.]|nr:glycosyltransferase [Chloracidobacterium sp.]
MFYFFAGILILLSFRSFRGGLEYLRFFRSELAKAASNFTPFVTVVAPCRGLDDGLKDNLLALFEQDYPEYEILFVVDDRNDAAVPIIEEVSRKAARAETRPVGSVPYTQLVVADKAVAASQKVENLREALLHADDRSEAFVFVDSDARPSKYWLNSLVAPLQDKTVGAASGYRWFISDKPSFASEMRSAWNASIASALGPNTKTNFCWGGSMAMRRDVFEKIEIRDKWRGTLSDDFAVTRAVNEADLKIVFVPQALTASVEDCSFSELLEFTTRQMKITRVYAPNLWLLSFVGSGLFNIVMILAFLIVIFSPTNDLPVFAAIATLVLVSIFSTGKAWLRLKAVKLVLTQYKTELSHQFWTQNTLWLLTPALFFYNSFAAWRSRRLKWRGITYELKSPTETVIITD